MAATLLLLLNGNLKPLRSREPAGSGRLCLACGREAGRSSSEDTHMCTHIHWAVSWSPGLVLSCLWAL